MKYLNELIRSNGHNLVLYSNAESNRIYVRVFDYSVEHGGTYDGFRYYNDYVVDIGTE